MSQGFSSRFNRTPDDFKDQLHNILQHTLLSARIEDINKWRNLVSGCLPGVLHPSSHPSNAAISDVAVCDILFPFFLANLVSWSYLSEASSVQPGHSSALTRRLKYNLISSLTWQGGGMSVDLECLDGDLSACRRRPPNG